MGKEKNEKKGVKHKRSKKEKKVLADDVLSKPRVKATIKNKVVSEVVSESSEVSRAMKKKLNNKTSSKSGKTSESSRSNDSAKSATRGRRQEISDKYSSVEEHDSDSSDSSESMESTAQSSNLGKQEEEEMEEMVERRVAKKQSAATSFKLDNSYKITKRDLKYFSDDCEYSIDPNSKIHNSKHNKKYMYSTLNIEGKTSLAALKVGYFITAFKFGDAVLGIVGFPATTTKVTILTVHIDDPEMKNKYKDALPSHLQEAVNGSPTARSCKVGGNFKNGPYITISPDEITTVVPTALSKEPCCDQLHSFIKNSIESSLAQKRKKYHEVAKVVILSLIITNYF